MLFSMRPDGIEKKEVPFQSVSRPEDGVFPEDG